MHKTPPLDCDFYFNGNKQQKKIDNNKTLLIINKKNTLNAIKHGSTL